MAHNKVPDTAKVSDSTKVPDTAKVSDTAKVPDTAKIFDTVREPDTSRGVDIVQAYKSLHGLKTLKVPKILFFDSGMGGLSVLSEVRKLNPGAAYYYLFDHEGFPYGQKSESYLVARVETLLSRVSAVLAPDLIVIACNTASTVVLDQIRPHFSRIPIVGVVPAIKTAGQLSRKRKIALLATPGTVQRAYTQRLIANFAADCEVMRMGTVELVWLAEQCLLDEVTAAQRTATQCTAPQRMDAQGEDIETPRLQLPASKLPELKAILAPIMDLPHCEQPDVVVLGCTHFPLLRADIAALLGPDITLVDSGAAIGRRVAYVLAQKQESLEVELGYRGSPNGAQDSLLNAVTPGAWVAWYTGSVPEAKRAQFAATFSYFGFQQVQSLALV